MSGERSQFPEHFTFSQRYGYKDLPEPMKLEYLSADLRRELYDAIYAFLNIEHIGYERDISYLPNRIISSYYIDTVVGKIKGVTKDEVPIKFYLAIKDIKSAILEEKFNIVLDSLEIIINESFNYEKSTSYMNTRRSQFVNEVIELFDKYDSAYHLNISQRPHIFYPRTSKKQGQATQQAIETVRQGKMDGAATHLQQAVEFINMKLYAKSVAESIGAVESVARKIDPASSKTLGPALDSLERADLLKHKALKKGFQRIYGYTNDEEGIRHPLISQSEADVALDEAIFMFGACASFAAYLTRKHQQQTKT